VIYRLPYGVDLVIYEMIRWQPEKQISKSVPMRTPKVSAFSFVYLKHLAQRNGVNLKRHNRTRLFVRLNSRASSRPAVPAVCIRPSSTFRGPRGGR